MYTKAITYSTKVYLLGIWLFIISPVFSQQTKEEKIDSLENIFFFNNKKDTSKLLEIGAIILQNNPSELKKYKVYATTSIAFHQNNNSKKAIEYLFKAKEVAETIGNPEILAKAYGSIANHYSYLNLTEKARPYLNKAIEQIEKLPASDNKHQLKGLSFLELGNLDFNDNNFTEANKNYKDALQEFLLVPKLTGKAQYNYQRSLYTVGNSYYYLKEADSSEVYLKKALEVNNPEGLNLNYYIYSTLSEVYSSRKNYSRAIDTLQSILKDEKFDITSLKSEIYLNLSKNYKSIGDTINYALYNKKHLELSRELENHDLKAINTAYEEEQEDLVTSISASKRKNQLLLIVVVFISILSLVSIFLLSRKKKKEKGIYKSVIAKLENQVLESSPIKNIVKEENSVNQSIPISVENEILEKLFKFEESEKFTNPKITLSTLAVQLKTNPTYLSSIIKNHKNKNFNSYINELRIQYICEKIHKNPKYLSYKISYLAEVCGFTSHGAFSTIFKNVIGISPSVFLREEEKNHLKTAAFLKD